LIQTAMPKLSPAAAQASAAPRPSRCRAAATSSSSTPAAVKGASRISVIVAMPEMHVE
jgi:hypothetical protein